MLIKELQCQKHTKRRHIPKTLQQTNMCNRRQIRTTDLMLKADRFPWKDFADEKPNIE